MKNPTIFDFNIWNPLSELYLAFVLKLRPSKHGGGEYYLLIGLGFCQFMIDFRILYLTIKTFRENRREKIFKKQLKDRNYNIENYLGHD